MAYEVSSSVANSSITYTDITGSSGKNYRGGYFNTTGDKLFIPTDKYEAGSNNDGVDIWTSSSGGWALTDSFGSNDKRIDIAVTISDTQFMAVCPTSNTTRDVYFWESGSGGWSRTTIGEDLSGYQAEYSIALSPDKDRVVFQQMGGPYMYLAYSGSGVGNLGWRTGNFSNEGVPRELDGSTSPDYGGVHWIDNDTVVYSDPKYSSESGVIVVTQYDDQGTEAEVKTSTNWGNPYNGDQTGDSAYGSSSDYKHLGSGIYYHSASTTMLMVGGDGGTTTRTGGHSDPTAVDLYGFKSASNGNYLGNGGNILTIKEDIYNWNPRGFLADPGNGDRFYAISNTTWIDDNGDVDGENSPILVAWESGSSGWSAAKASTALRHFAQGNSTYSHASVRADGQYVATAAPSSVNSGNNVRVFKMFSTGDSVAPTITSVTSTTGDGTKKVGDTINITVNFSEAVTLSGGNLVVTLETGDTDQTVTISSISSATSASGTYTVQAGDVSADLTVSSIALSAGTLSDGTNNMSDFSIGTNLAASSALVIDGVAPEIDSVAIQSATNGQNSYLNEDDVVTVRVAYDEAVTVVTSGGTPFVLLDIGGTFRTASYSAGTTTANIDFAYTIASSETTDTGGISINADIALNGGTLKDAAGNSAETTFTAISDNSSYLVDTTSPTISSLSMASDNSTVTVTFGENVYTGADGTGNLAVGDFAITGSGGNMAALAINATPSAIVRTNQTTWILTLDGTALTSNATGDEELTIDSASDTSIYDLAGNAHTNSATVDLNATTAIADSVGSSLGSTAGVIKAGGFEHKPSATLTVPAGALSSDITLTVDASPSNMTKTQAATLLSVAGEHGSIISDIVSLEPHGQQFKKVVTIVLDITGSNEGSCPSNLQVFKRNGPSADDIWYPMPSNLWSCTTGSIEISTMSFSQYMATEVTSMKRTRLSDNQLEKIVSNNKVKGASLDVTGSGTPKSHMIATDMFLIQSTSGVPQQVSASIMQDFFSSVDVTASGGNASMSVVFNQANGHPLASDPGILYNPSSNLLTVTGEIDAGSLDISGNCDIDGTTSLDAVDIDGVVQIDGATTFGVNDTGVDVKMFGATDGSYWLWDESADGVVQVGSLTVGVDDAGHDVKFFGDTASAYMLWDASADDLILGGAAGLDVDGTTNLDAVDIDGAVQIDGATTFGVNDTGVDVKMFGATSGAYLLWDESADDLILAGAAGLDVAGTTNLDAVDIDGAVDMASTLQVDGVLTTTAASVSTGGMAVATTSKVQFRDTAIYIHSSADGQLDLVADTEIQIAATTIDINGAVALDGAITGATNITLSGELDAATLDVSGIGDIADTLTLSKGSGNGLVVTADSDLNGGLDVAGTVALGASGGSADTTVRGDLAVGENLTVTGNLTISGTTTTVNSTEVAIADKVFVAASGSNNGAIATAGGAGIAIGGDDGSPKLATFLYDGVDSWDLSDHLNLASSQELKINDVSTLSATTLGTAVVNSSLTSLGTQAEALNMGSYGITSAGAIAGATTIDASGDLTVATITNAEFTVDASGNTDIDGTLNVEGVPTFQAAAVFSSGITTAGAIAGATSITGSLDLAVGTISMAEFTVARNGNTDIDGTLNVEGVPTFQAGAVFSGGVTTAGAIAGATTVSGSGQFSMSHIDLDGTLAGGGNATIEGIVSGAAGTFDALSGTSLALQNGGITNAGAIAGATTITLSGELDAGSLDISGNCDIDGTTSLDAVDIDGVVQIDGATTFGVNDTGVDVKFFGDTASAYMMWDTSADDLVFAGAAGINITKDKLLIGGTAVTTTAAELNLLDNVSGLVQADFTKLAAVDASAAEINLLDSGAGSSVALATGDGLLMFDANDNNDAKKVLMSDVGTLLGSGDGIQVASGVLSVVPVTDVLASHRTGSATAGLSADLQTASLNGAALTGSLSVFVNGLLQTASGSFNVATSQTGNVFDYWLEGGDASTKVILQDALDDDDILTIKYIKN